MISLWDVQVGDPVPYKDRVLVVSKQNSKSKYRRGHAETWSSVIAKRRTPPKSLAKLISKCVGFISIFICA